jgi:hypothetical protein
MVALEWGGQTRAELRGFRTGTFDVEKVRAA